MSEGDRGAADRQEPEEWQKGTEEGEKNIRESLLEGDESSEYIQGAILEASKSETENAKSTETNTSRLQLWLADNVTNHESLGRMLYSANPYNYDRLDWLFAFSFVVLMVAAVVMFQTTTVAVTIGSLVVMFFAFISMLMCAGIEDILKEGYHKISGEEAEDSEAFEQGESLE
jgi:hypothetical protein